MKELTLTELEQITVGGGGGGRRKKAVPPPTSCGSSNALASACGSGQSASATGC